MFANDLTIFVMAVWSIIALWGFYRGAMRTVISISILIISIAASVFLSPKVNEMLTASSAVNKFAEGQAGSFVEARISSIESGSMGLEWAELLPLPDGVKDVVAEGDPAVIGALLGTETVKTYLTELVSGFFIRLMSVIVTFLLAYLIMFVVRIIFSVVAEAPVISGMNRFAGLVLGVIKGAVIIWIVFAVIRAMSVVGESDSGLIRQITESEVLSIMYNYNPVFTVLPKVLGLL